MIPLIGLWIRQSAIHTRLLNDFHIPLSNEDHLLEEAALYHSRDRRLCQPLPESEQSGQGGADDGGSTAENGPIEPDRQAGGQQGNEEMGGIGRLTGAEGQQLTQ